MKINFVEMKENEARKRLKSTMREALLLGVTTGVIVTLIIGLCASIKVGVTFAIICVLLALAEAYLIKDFSLIYGYDIEIALRPIIWDMKVLKARNERLDETIDMLRSQEENDNIEYCGELENTQYEEPLSDIVKGENEEE